MNAMAAAESRCVTVTLGLLPAQFFLARIRHYPPDYHETSKRKYRAQENKECRQSSSVPRQIQHKFLSGADTLFWNERVQESRQRENPYT
jgi:hypothetical protein